MRSASNSQTANRVTASTIALVLGLLSATSIAETVIVEMKKFKFVPDEITIKAGDTVRWLNTERRQYHTIWFKEAGDKETAELFPEEFFEKTFDTPGEYPYLCGPHWEKRDMKGVVHVVP